MIYKTFFGKHIDLSKVISISDASVQYVEYNQIYARFEIECMLLEHPIVHREEISHHHEPITTSTKDTILFRSPMVTLIDDTKILLRKADHKKIKEVHELQLKIDELVEVWKKSLKQ